MHDGENKRLRASSGILLSENSIDSLHYMVSNRITVTLSMQGMVREAIKYNVS